MTTASARWNEYHTPTALADALAILACHGERARIIAGGTDLILDMDGGHAPGVDVLVDVTRIAGLDQIAETDAGIVYLTGSAGSYAAQRMSCATGYNFNTDVLCELLPVAMYDCTAATTTQILELDISSSATAITVTLASGGDSPDRIYTSAVLRVPRC